MARVLSFSTKICPYCAETIKRRAVVCRFCGYDLRTGKPTRPSLASLQESEDDQPIQNQGPVDQDPLNKTLGCGTFIIGALLFLGLCVVLSILL